MSLSIFVLLATSAAAQTAFNTTLVSQYPLTDCSDVSADGDLVFVGRRAGGLSILTVEDEAHPLRLSTWTHPTAPMDIVGARPLNGILWLANQSDVEFCLAGLDLTDPENPTIVSQLWRPPLSRRVHNLWADGTHLYLSGSGAGGGNYIVNVSNPAAPFVDALIGTGIHDNSVVQDTLYIAGGYTGFFLYDVAMPSSPILLAAFDATTPDTLFYAHNAWPIRNTRFVALGEEVAVPVVTGLFEQGSMRIVDFRNLLEPVQVYRWRSESAAVNPFVTIHNIYVVGNFAYVSYYQDGLKILDVSDPTHPVEVAFYDTFPDEPTELFQGCWGVFPFQGVDRIFLSDRTYGFFHVAFNGARKSTVRGVVRDSKTLAPIAGATVRSETALRRVTTGADGRYTLETGSGTHLLRVLAAGYQPADEIVALADLGIHEEDFLLDDSILDAPETIPGSAFVLKAPAPNPAHAPVRLTIEVPPGVTARLEVFDARGRLVRSLGEHAPQDGSRELSWDGRSGAGLDAPPGTYEIRLSAGAVQRTAKVTLLE